MQAEADCAKEQLQAQLDQQRQENDMLTRSCAGRQQQLESVRELQSEYVRVLDVLKAPVLEMSQVLQSVRQQNDVLGEDIVRIQEEIKEKDNVIDVLKDMVLYQREVCDSLTRDLMRMQQLNNSKNTDRLTKIKSMESYLSTVQEAVTEQHAQIDEALASK
jgi:chromosome segregation ATPase